MYLKIETDNKNEVLLALEKVIDNGGRFMLFSQKLENGDFYLEAIEQKEEPIISS